MKKTKLLKVGILSALLACGMIFCTSCKQPNQTEEKPEVEKPADEEKPGTENPATAIKEFGKGEIVKFADLEITSENAANYLLKVSFTLDNPEKKGWGAGAICDTKWTDLKINALEVNEEGFIDIEISDIIAKTDSFLINWWADYATLLKCEIIKK